jgi:hypothetical protein
MAQDWERHGATKRCFRLYNDLTYKQLAEVMCADAPTEGDDDRPKPVIDFIMVPRGLDLKFRFPADRQIHLILGGQSLTPRIHKRTGLMPFAQPDRYSYQEEEQQLGWVARQRFDFPHSAAAYVYIPNSAQQYPPQEESRRLIDSEHLGGFICALTEFSGWDNVDAVHISQSILDENLWYEACKCLIVQRVLDATAPAPEPRLVKPLLSHPRLFHAVLPLVKYDYRLAVLIALPSEDWIVTRIKTQLAAMLTVGCARLLDVTGLRKADSDQIQAL